MDERRLLGLAEQLATGEKIDWASEVRSTPDRQEREVVRSLRVLASLSEMLSSDLEPQMDMDEADEPTSTGMRVRTPPSDDLPETLDRWGHLERLERVGKGSYGTVYRAWDPKLQIWVALKIGRRDESMLEEARLLARLRHENVVRIYGAEEHDGRSGIWMELVHGRSLAEIVQFEGRMSEEAAVRAGRTLARALAAVHSQGVIHEDIKAYNVMREDGGRLVLMDFGAGVKQEDAWAASVNGHIRGTPFYLAPEILDGEPATIQSDMYSLGVLLFHLVTGQYPVDAPNAALLRRAHDNRRRLADVRPDLSAGFCAIVERALDSDPRRRYESAGRMAHALESLERRPIPITRILAAAAVVVGLVTAGFWYWVQSHAYNVEASLYRDGRVGEQLLVSGSRVQTGDRLFLEMRATKPLHVYVINEDETGVATLLFPIPGLVPSNPLSPEQLHHLPGALESEKVFWQVTSAGIREMFLVVASPEPLFELENIVAALPPARFGSPIQYPQLDESALSGLRGMTGLTTKSPTQPTADDSLFRRIQALTGEPEMMRGVWIRRIDLENPAL